MFDAVSLACWKLAAYPEQERVARVLVVLSDGEDNSSHRSLKQVIEEAESKGVTVYTVSTSEDSGAKTDADRVLQLLAERSGGESLFPGDTMVLDKSLGRLRDLIRSRYLIAYKAAGFEPNGKYRTLHIVAEKDGKHLQVHARKGYYARVESPNNQATAAFSPERRHETFFFRRPLPVRLHLNSSNQLFPGEDLLCLPLAQSSGTWAACF